MVLRVVASLRECCVRLLSYQFNGAEDDSVPGSWSEAPQELQLRGAAVCKHSGLVPQVFSEFLSGDGDVFEILMDIPPQTQVNLDIIIGSEISAAPENVCK